MKKIILFLCMFFNYNLIYTDAVFTGNASDGENGIYYEDYNFTVGNALDTPEEWVGFSRQYSTEDDSYSANDGNTYRVGRQRRRINYVPQNINQNVTNEIFVDGADIVEEVACK